MDTVTVLCVTKPSEKTKVKVVGEDPVEAFTVHDVSVAAAYFLNLAK